MLGPNIGVCIYPPAASNAPTVDETAQFDRRRQHERDMNYGPFCIKTADLDVSANRFTAVGGSSLANVLSNNKFLQVLQAAENRIGPKGVESLAHALRSNATLLQLDLGDNALEDRGALHLADMLSDGGASQLRGLELKRNRISSRGTEMLAKALETAKWLDHVGLMGNFCGSEWEPYVENLCLKSSVGNGGYPQSPSKLTELGRSSMSKAKDSPSSRKAMVLPDTIPEASDEPEVGEVSQVLASTDGPPK